MRAALCRAYGPPESLVVDDVPSPALRDGAVLVEIQAASVNFPDVLMVANEYQVTVPTPFIPGSEFAGVVAAVAADVTSIEVGDRVFGSAFVGAFAEQTTLPAAMLTAVPDSVSMPEAASFGVVYTTAYHALRGVADVQPGEWVAVLGAAGGVGLASVDLARHLGARVVAAASTDEKVALCRARGADAVINYETEDLKVRLKELTDGGADVVIDPVGGRYSEEALRATRWGGRFVVVGFASGTIPRIPLNLILLKGVIVKGFELRTFAEFAPEVAARDRDELLESFGQGRIHPYVSDVFALERVGEALRAVADRRALGKVVVDPTQ